MYSLVVLLSILSSASFVLAFVRGERRHVLWLGVWLGLLLYTHTWGLFLAASMAGAWLVLYRRRQVPRPRRPAPRRRAGRALRAVAAGRGLPDRAHRRAVGGAPVAAAAARRSRAGCSATSRCRCWRSRCSSPSAATRRSTRPCACSPRWPSATTVLAWLCSQIEPAWATRYLAVVLGPLLLALASVVSKGRALDGAGARRGRRSSGYFSGPPPTKSNVRTVSHGVAPAIRPGDVVISTQPEQVPALYRYLPRGVVYLTPMGLVQDPRQTDWRNGLARLRDGQAETRAAARDRPPGQRPARPDRHARSRASGSRRRRGRARSASARASGARRCRPASGCRRSARWRRSRGARTPCARSSTRSASGCGRAGGRRGRSAARRRSSGPCRCRCGPTKTFTAPAATKRSTRSCASVWSTSDGLVARASVAVLARVEDVGVEPVLVRRVAEPAEVAAELAAVGARQVHDPDALGAVTVGPVLRAGRSGSCGSGGRCRSGATRGSGSG